MTTRILSPISRKSLSSALLTAALIVSLAPAAAQASPKTLERSLTNIVFSPLDLFFSPVVAGMLVYTGLTDISDTTGVRVAYTVPGFFWATGTNMGASLLRGISGMIQLVPGVLLLPFPTDMDPLMDPVDNGDGLVWTEIPYLETEIKFGINFMQAAY